MSDGADIVPSSGGTVNHSAVPPPPTRISAGAPSVSPAGSYHHHRPHTQGGSKPFAIAVRAVREESADIATGAAAR